MNYDDERHTIWEAYCVQCGPLTDEPETYYTCDAARRAHLAFHKGHDTSIRLWSADTAREER